jgi:hypothetical protein
MIPSLEAYCGFKQLGWQFFKYGEFYKLGDVLFMHGDRCGMNVSMGMIRKYGSNVVHGHDHGAAIRYFANAVNRVWALNCGHLSDMKQVVKSTQACLTRRSLWLKLLRRIKLIRKTGWTVSLLTVVTGGSTFALQILNPCFA